MKNKRIIILSLISAAVIVLCIIPVLSFLVSLIFGIETKVVVETFYFSNLTLENNGKTFVEVIPFLLSISLVEVSVAILRKTSLSSWRFALIIISLVLVGNMIYKVFYEAICSVVNFSTNSQTNLFDTIQVVFPYNLIIMIGTIFLFFIYANRVTRKIKDYIN